MFSIVMYQKYYGKFDSGFWTSGHWCSSLCTLVLKIFEKAFRLIAGSTVRAKTKFLYPKMGQCPRI